MKIGEIQIEQNYYDFIKARGYYKEYQIKVLIDIDYGPSICVVSNSDTECGDQFEQVSINDAAWAMMRIAQEYNHRNRKCVVCGVEFMADDEGPLSDGTQMGHQCCSFKCQDEYAIRSQAERAVRRKMAEQKKKAGWNYLMVDHNTGYHKIGYSKNPRYREKTLQSEKPTIEMLFKWRGGFGQEQELHEHFSDKRIRGEWFDLTAEDVKYIETLKDKNK